MKRFRMLRGRFDASPDGRQSWGVGFRFGYWPCVQGPYLQVAYGVSRVSIWWGTPGNWKGFA